MAYIISGAPSTIVNVSNVSNATLNTSNVSTGYTINSSGSSSMWNGTTGATVTISNDLHGSTLTVKGDADISGDLKVQGKSIAESLEAIEERLAILRPNEELEEKWDNLRGLRKLYMELEAEIIEKEKIWKILKK
jgi:hypothetical protein